MESTDIDIGDLTPVQQAALEQYTAVTGQDVEAAIPLLQRAQWNTQIAITRFFDGEPEVDPVQEALSAAAPQDTRRQETLAESLQFSRHRSRIPPAPRIVPPPNPELNYRPGFPFNIILAPFSLASYILTRVFRIFAPLIPFLPTLLARLKSQDSTRVSNRRSLKPRDTAARFIREFEEQYGSNQLPFRELGYAHSLDEAKRDLKYLLVVILSPEHDDNDLYVQETLLAPEVIAFVQNKDSNIILWGGSIQDSEAYQVATAFNVTKFPYAALIASTPNSSSSSSFATSGTGMGIIAPLSGLLPPAEFLSKIRRAMDSHMPEINRLRSEQAERNATRSIREQQDSAYDRSLAKDRERAKQKREEEEKRKQEEESERKAEEQREQAAHKSEGWKMWRAVRIKPEPSTSDQNAVRVSLRLPDGSRAMRKFEGSAEVEEIYAFVECAELLDSAVLSKEIAKPEGYDHQYPFKLVSPMPRTVYDINSQGTIREVIGRSANLIVEPIDVDDEDDDDV
ncbi:UBX-domain-containing protein [Microthyrium microscopicum]|uniref:UBX-domain-containing protein n=1 Tax=Microthyrium microscopicum TaxID=703497 RepID=A0A6A6ULS3_9PEZI|nr:UBX-domain-containing protein [Microthyrium microscopicum]